MTLNGIKKQTVMAPLEVGDYIVLGENTEKEYREDGTIDGYRSDPLFEGKVKTHNPRTGELRFTEETRTEDIGKVEFIEYLKECDRYEVIKR